MVASPSRPPRRPTAFRMQIKSRGGGAPTTQSVAVCASFAVFVLYTYSSANASLGFFTTVLETDASKHVDVTNEEARRGAANHVEDVGGVTQRHRESLLTSSSDSQIIGASSPGGAARGSEAPAFCRTLDRDVADFNKWNGWLTVSGRQHPSAAGLAMVDEIGRSSDSPFDHLHSVPSPTFNFIMHHNKSCVFFFHLSLGTNEW